MSSSVKNLAQAHFLTKERLMVIFQSCLREALTIDLLEAWLNVRTFLRPYLKGFDACLPASARCTFVSKFISDLRNSVAWGNCKLTTHPSRENSSTRNFFNFFSLTFNALKGGISTIVTVFEDNSPLTSNSHGVDMGRTKKADKETLLVHRIFTRINDKSFQRLESLIAKSDCHTIGQLVRHILSKERIIIYNTEVTVAEPVHINQITHAFHRSESPEEKVFHSLKVADEYEKVGDKVEVLINMVAEIGERWLQRSFQEKRSEV